MASSPWPLIHAERKALAEDLRQLAESQWATQSLCSDWTIRDALAHMTATAKMTPPRFFGKFMASGFRFDAMSAKDVAAERGSSGADALARFTAMLDATTHPPGPVEAMVGEAVVHSEDIRRPLGIHHRYSDEALTRTADFYRSSNLLIGAKRRADGLTLRADDVAWTAGSGPEVIGPLASIILAITGRRVGLDDLSGDGLATLRGRA
ncbi:MAG TPA: maleylpyruvate isomerase family mycothiol-dependent enzyme [Candidatus Dormibacteraeota bacterium]|jgi:uncharacterized protein (TIGR03083 family)